MNTALKSIIKGLLSYTPVKHFLIRKGTGGTDSARYCYSVWLRHLVLLYQSGMKEHPKIIAELGPGDSLGIGMAAILSGAEKYFAFDVIKHSNLKQNISILEELINLFLNQTDIPDESEFPDVKPKISNYSFPKEILPDKNFISNRIEQIKNALNGLKTDIQIEYIVPWNSNIKQRVGSVDLIFSQAVMEHIIDIEDAYFVMNKWLRNGGYISHQIDYRAHETHKVWNGHWRYSDLIWKIIMHGRSYPISRLPHSAHLNAIKKNGFEIISLKPVESSDGFSRVELKKTHIKYEDSDFIISSAHIIARKP